MKKFEFAVFLTPNEPFEPTQEQWEEMRFKIKDALEHEVEAGSGLMPEDSETWTAEIAVIRL